ncbi:CheW protein [Thioploca ingrica]|uniref:CheW protein n=1 Tax=Thioploca ingrica TaxID=40754 RepID=A0A090AJ22_9GAMM|nr:CheW protein [Thioploca ingrica]
MTDNGKIAEPFILFAIGKATYGVHSRLVQQMEMIEEITPLPNAPPFVEGIVLSRGQVIPAINLRARFGFEKISHDTRTRLIVVNIKERTIGFVVDTAREFVSIPTEAIQPPPEKMSGLSGKYIEGIAKLKERLILILNIEEILETTDMVNVSPQSSHQANSD